MPVRRPCLARRADGASTDLAAFTAFMAFMVFVVFLTCRFEVLRPGVLGMAKCGLVMQHATNLRETG